MKIIIGLWNWRKEIQWSRHNIWHMFIDYIWEMNSSVITEDKEDNIIMINFNNDIYIKHMWCINDSWLFVDKVVKTFKLIDNQLIIVHDDIDMTLWKIRIKRTWSSWWHNWIKDIIKYIWDNFTRIKVWIWRPESWDISQYVLWNFSQSELNKIDELKCFNKVLSIIDKESSTNIIT